MQDNARMDFRSEQVSRGEAAHATYKLFSGGAEMSRSFAHEAARYVDQGSVYLMVEVCNGRMSQQLREFLVPECREQIPDGRRRT